MKLVDYVSEVLTENKHAKSFPDDIDIPKAFVDRFWELYSDGERRGLELGTNVHIESGQLKLSDKVHQGVATGINIPNDPAAENFGDVHVHPSSSIGHVKGFAAHSGEDFLAIDNNKTKPLFARFVASGTCVYLAIYRQGHSTIDKSAICKVRDDCANEAANYLEAHCLVDRDARNEAMAAMNGSKEMDAYMVQRRRETPGLGKEMQRLSIEGGKKIAQTGNFGFYMGDQGWGVSVSAYGYLQLKKVS